MVYLPVVATRVSLFELFTTVQELSQTHLLPSLKNRWTFKVINYRLQCIVFIPVWIDVSLCHAVIQEGPVKSNSAGKSGLLPFLTPLFLQSIASPGQNECYDLHRITLQLLNGMHRWHDRFVSWANWSLPKSSWAGSHALIWQQLKGKAVTPWQLDPLMNEGKAPHLHTLVTINHDFGAHSQ